MAEYFIDGANGSDANNGLTVGAPLRTFGLAVNGGSGNNMPDGTIVNLLVGTTVDLVGKHVALGSCTIRPYGSGAKPELLWPMDAVSGGELYGTGAIGTTFTIDSIVMRKRPRASIPVFGESIGAFHVGTGKLIVSDCVIDGPFLNAVSNARGSGSIIRRNEITGALNNGVWFGDNAYVAPSDCEISGNRIIVPDATNDCITLHDGLTGGVNNKIIGNYLYSGTENNIDVLGMYSDTVVADNYLIAGPKSGTTASGNALLTCQTAMRVHRNKFYSNRTTCLQHVGTSALVDIQGNAFFGYQNAPLNNPKAQMITCSNANTNFRIIGNSFIGRAGANAGGSLFTFTTQMPLLVFKNNIVVRSPGDPYTWFFMAGGAGNPVGDWANNIYVVPTLGVSQYNGKTLAAFKVDYATDANSYETLTSPLDALGRPATLAPRTGVFIDHNTYDADGMMRNNPPSIGAYEYVEPRDSRL